MTKSKCCIGVKQAWRFGEDYPEHARGTYRYSAKAFTQITNSLRCNFGIGIHPRVNRWFSIFTEINALKKAKYNWPTKEPTPDRVDGINLIG